MLRLSLRIRQCCLVLDDMQQAGMNAMFLFNAEREYLSMGVTENETKSVTNGRSVKAIAADFGISPGLVRLEIARGRLKPLRIGRRVIITDAAIQKWLDASGDAR